MVLPSEYRDFVMKIGHGGAGPFYGLFELNGSDPENITDLEQIKKPFRWTDATNPMQGQNAETEDGILIDSDGKAGEAYRCDYSFREPCSSPSVNYYLVIDGTQFARINGSVVQHGLDERMI